MATVGNVYWPAVALCAVFALYRWASMFVADKTTRLMLEDHTKVLKNHADKLVLHAEALQDLKRLETRLALRGGKHG